MMFVDGSINTKDDQTLRQVQNALQDKKALVACIQQKRMTKHTDASGANVTQAMHKKQNYKASTQHYNQPIK